MVKVNVGALQTQVNEAKAYCVSLRNAAISLSNVTGKMGLEVGISGATGDSIKNYIGSTYPALSKAFALHAENFEQANQVYSDGYMDKCEGVSLFFERRPFLI